ncbi:MAG: NAD-dependent epimerase/dehydratase family protein [Acidimicrobiales bacterium]
MQTVVLTAGATPLGRRVLDLLAVDAGVERVVEITDDQLRPQAEVELKRVMEGATNLVHLHDDAPATRAVLEAAGAIGVGHAVVLSSTTVYGAWSTNPVPLTEEAPVRPNPELSLAVKAAERERLAGEWVANHPGASVAVLRAAVPVAEDDDGSLVRALRTAAGPVDAGDDAPAQFIHLADLAAAVDLARRRRLDGPFNVAPDGWITGEALRALAGGPRVRLPDRFASRLAELRWRLLLAPDRPGLTAYARHPWVVANDRLRAEGWVPSLTNEEAFVATAPAAPWATVSPRRRQEIALGAAVVAVGAAVAGGVVLVRWVARRRAD